MIQAGALLYLMMRGPDASCPHIWTGRGRRPCGAGLPTGFAVPVLETGSPGPAGFASTATGLAVPVLETGKGGRKAGAGRCGAGLR